jgi:hypothetical protein
MQEAEIRKIMVQNQPGQIVLKTLSQKTLSQKIGLVDWLKVKALKKKTGTCMVAYTCNASTQEAKAGGLRV